jgi:hypothetical protein
MAGSLPGTLTRHSVSRIAGSVSSTLPSVLPGHIFNCVIITPGLPDVFPGSPAGERPTLNGSLTSWQIVPRAKVD